jgi:hypothetical protein
VNSRRGARRSGRRTRYLGGFGLSLVACAAFLAIPGGASAAIQPNCSGKLGLNKKTSIGPHGATYQFKCDTDAQGYSLGFSKKIDYFQPDPDVLQPDGEVSPDNAFECSGPFPGYGIGCPGKYTAGNTVSGLVATVKAPCNPSVQAFVSIVFQNFDKNDQPFTSVTHPFQLRSPAGCPKPSSKSHRRHRAHRRAHARH